MKSNLQGDASMSSGYLPLHRLRVLPHNAHQFPGAQSYNLIVMHRNGDKIMIKYLNSTQYLSVAFSYTSSPTSVTRPPFFSCSSRSI